MRSSSHADLFYRVATEIVERAWEGQSTLTIGEAVAVLLQTWNKTFYRYRKFDSQHFEAIEALLEKHKATLHTLRQRSIEEFSPKEAPDIRHLFKEFDEALGHVGAAKCLHLLAPRFFPLWDNAIAKAYGLPLTQMGQNAAKYCRFMEIVKEQVQRLGGEQAIARNPLKAIDEYNYCRYTKRLM